MNQQKRARFGLAILGLAASFSLIGAHEASARGCNGVVNQLEWGCAAWDNNNGPQYPHYKGAATSKPATPAAPAAAAPKPSLAPNAGAGIVAQGGGNLAQKNGNGIVAQGGGNVAPKNPNGIVAQGGGNLKNGSGN